MTEIELREKIAEAKSLNNVDNSLQAQVDALVEFILELKTAGLQQETPEEVPTSRRR